MAENQDDWSTKEKFTLACCVARSGNQNWGSVSRMMKAIMESGGHNEGRSLEMYGQRNCAVKYNELLSTASMIKRKNRHSDVVGNVETPAEQVLRKLTQERHEELQKGINEERERYRKLKSDMQKILSGEFDEQLLTVWKMIQDGQHPLENILSDGISQTLNAPATSSSGPSNSDTSHNISRPQRAPKETAKFKDYIEQRQKQQAKYNNQFQESFDSSNDSNPNDGSSILSNLLTAPAVELKAAVNKINENLKDPTKDSRQVASRESYKAYKKVNELKSIPTDAPTLEKLLESSSQDERTAGSFLKTGIDNEGKNLLSKSVDSVMDSKTTPLTIEICDEYKQTDQIVDSSTVKDETADAYSTENNPSALSGKLKRKCPTIATPTIPSPSSPLMSLGMYEMDSLQQQRAWRKSIMLVWKSAASHRYANVFLQPVTDEVAPGYSNIVFNPMDLSLIKKNIENGVINTTAQFQRDILIMFQNALMYNRPEHDVYQMAKEMREEILQQIQSYIETQKLFQSAESKKGKFDVQTMGSTRHSGKGPFVSL